MKHLLEVFKRFGLEHGQNRWYLIERIILQALENQKLSSPWLNTNLILGKTSSSPSPFLPFKVSSAQFLLRIIPLPSIALSWPLFGQCI